MSNVRRRMHTLQTWFMLKTGGRKCSVIAEAHATEEWKRFTGRAHYAKVTLRAYPAMSFEFLSAPGAWPNKESEYEYEPYVLDGIVSELLAGAGPAVIGVRVVLESTTVHEVESNSNAFYQAARLATAQLLNGPTGQPRANCTESDA
jgi:translation elongation factor EF-G